MGIEPRAVKVYFCIGVWRGPHDIPGRIGYTPSLHREARMAVAARPGRTGYAREVVTVGEVVDLEQVDANLACIGLARRRQGPAPVSAWSGRRQAVSCAP